MGKDMFYKYQEGYKEPCRCECFVKPNARPIRRFNGEPIGIQADQNSTFDLFFKADPEQYELATFLCTIYDYTYHEVISMPAYWTEGNMICATITASDKTLPYGVYKVELDALIDGEQKQIFAPNESVLSIG